MSKLFLALLLLLTAPAFAQNALAPAGAAVTSCVVENVTATTQCFPTPAANLTWHISGFTLSNEAVTAQSLQIVSGTGSNCGTGVAALTHKIAMTTAIGSVANSQWIIPVAGQAVCVSPTAATAFGATLTGWLAP